MNKLTAYEQAEQFKKEEIESAAEKLNEAIIEIAHVVAKHPAIAKLAIHNRIVNGIAMTTIPTKLPDADIPHPSATQAVIDILKGCV